MWNFNDVSPKKQDFWPRINIRKGKKSVRMTIRRRLDIIIENKVVQKLKLENNVFNKKWSPKLIFFNDIFS